MEHLHGTGFISALSISLCLGALGGCSPSTSIDTPPDAVQPDTCNLALFVDLVGQPVSGIDASELPSSRRIVFASSAGLAFTDAERLTIITNSAGQITRVRCG